MAGSLREALATAIAKRKDAEAEPGRRDAAASRLFETAMARRDEIADLKAKEAELRAAQRNWRISEALDDPVTGPAPAALEPLLHAIGVAEDELSVLEEAATEARRRADDLRLSGEEDRAKRAERRAISDILVEKWSQEFANWDRAMSVQVIVEQLRSEGVMMPNLLLVSSDRRIEAQRYGRSILPLLLADPQAEIPAIPGSQEGAGRAEDSERR